jgi:DNA replication protein DnaC
MQYAKHPEGWFFIGGQSGAGKTHICTAICREFLMEGKEVKYMLWRDDVVKLKNAVTDPEYESLVEKYKRVEVLYIDDLFKTGTAADGTRQRPTGADINVAFEILNFRYNDPKLLTIISSECTIDSIIDIDEATGGRIFEKAKSSFSLKPDRSRNYRLRGVTEL